MHELEARETVETVRRLAGRVDTARVRAAAPAAIAAAARRLLEMAGDPDGDPAPLVSESAAAIGMQDRKSVVWGNGVDVGGGRLI